MDKGAWWATVPGLTKSQTRLSGYLSLSPFGTTFDLKVANLRSSGLLSPLPNGPQGSSFTGGHCNPPFSGGLGRQGAGGAGEESNLRVAGISGSTVEEPRS